MDRGVQLPCPRLSPALLAGLAPSHESAVNRSHFPKALRADRIRPGRRRIMDGPDLRGSAWFCAQANPEEDTTGGTTGTGDCIGRLAQPVRASVLHTEGQRFEPSIAHQYQTLAHALYSGPDIMLTRLAVSLRGDGDQDTFSVMAGPSSSSLSTLGWRPQAEVGL